MQFDFGKSYIKFDLKLKHYHHPIPCYLRTSKSPETTQTIVIFVNGLNGTKQILHYMPDNLQNAHIISFDARSCGENKNSTTIYQSYFIHDLFNVVFNIKKIFTPLGIEHYVLLGESFGSAISTLFYKRHQKMVDAVIIWNMPKKIIDITHSSKKTNSKIGTKLVWSFLTNLPTFSVVKDTSKLLINNRLYFLTAHKNEPKDNRNVIVAWLATRYAWYVLFNMIKYKKMKTPFLYISTSEDVLIDQNQVNHLERCCHSKKFSKYNKIYHLHFAGGKHCLLMDDKAGVLLIKYLNELVKNLEEHKETIPWNTWKQQAEEFFKN